MGVSTADVSFFFRFLGLVYLKATEKITYNNFRALFSYCGHMPLYAYAR